MAVTANYETVMIVSMKKGEEGIQAIVEKFKALIEKHATLKNVDEWGKRKLAYLINKESEGYYVLFDFESEAEFPAELDRIYNAFVVWLRDRKPDYTVQTLFRSRVCTVRRNAFNDNQEGSRIINL